MKEKLNTIQQEVVELVQHWQNQQKQDLKKQVFDILNGKTEEILLQLLGLRTFGGKWEVDSNNQSSITKFLKQQLEQVAEEWSRETAKNIDLDSITFSPWLKRKLRESYENLYKYRLEEYVKQAAVAKANIDGEAIVKKFFQSEVEEEKTQP